MGEVVARWKLGEVVGEVVSEVEVVRGLDVCLWLKVSAAEFAYGVQAVCE